MFIKKIIISGFRSYSETKTTLDLSSGHNVIIGGNGCGKSNVLNAIQFVLSDEFNGLDPQHRQQLIYETNATKKLMNAFVEIIVDNSDRRMPLESNQISFRRQIGLQKNQYFMNGKIVSHSDIANLLETAGFSRSNPYYIVKQGKVNEMAVSSDEYRLNVMREVAGTSIYDQRKSESLKMLAESRQRSQQIDDCLKALDEKLDILKTESKDLEKYLDWDRKRRLLEFIIVSKESEQMKKQILRQEEKQNAENRVLDEKTVQLQADQQKIRQLDKKLKANCNELEEYRQQLSELNATIDGLTLEKARIESKISDSTEKMGFRDENEKTIHNELREVKQLIETKKKSMSSLNLKYEDLKKKENQITLELSAYKSRKLELYSKQKRKESFRTVEERNRWIKSELTLLSQQIDTNVKRVADLKAEEFDIFQKKIQLESEQKGFDSQESDLLTELQNEKKEICDKNQTIKRLQSKRSELFDTENDLKEKELKLIEEKVKIESKLKRISGTSSSVGRESVQKVLKSFEQMASSSRASEARFRPLIDGYLGQVIDCFQYEDKLSKAIEVTLKNKMFYHILENDKIGTKIISEINKNQMFGEINFIPINKLQTKPVNYPELGTDARPLNTLIKSTKKYEKVMEFLFARTLVCRDIEVATTLSRKSRLDCVTLDGDFISHKGFMTGGYYSGETRMETFRKWKDIVSEIESIRQKRTETVAERDNNERVLSGESVVLSEMDIKHNKTQRKLENIRISRQQIRNQLSDLNAKHESIGKSISSLETTIPAMRANRDSFECELTLSLDSQLNENETKELAEILRSIERLAAEHKTVCTRRARYGSQLSTLKADLDRNLEQRKHELELNLINHKIYENETQLENELFDSKLIDQKIDTLRNRSEELNTRIDKLMKQLIERNEHLDNLRLSEDKQKEIITIEAKKSRHIGSRLETMMKKNEECLKKLRNLGTIPSDSDYNYQNLSLTQQYKGLRKCNKMVAEFSDVNQKALDQLTDGQRKQSLLKIEKQNLDSGYHSIEKLIEDLEHRKYEAIQLTYKAVSKYFCEVFKQLVPEGQAFIDMIYAESAVNSTQSTHSSQESQSSGGISRTGQTPAFNRIDNFTGVSIKVAFSGQTVVKELYQLSGGQKAIVALSFIFAIQRCDPAPFYLFDEVDQALDPLYRTTLSDIIKEMAKTSQFITTTFRPELLDSADKFFGVQYRNRVSHIQQIDGEVAKQFIQSEGSRGQARRKRRSVRFDTTDEQAINTSDGHIADTSDGQVVDESGDQTVDK